MINNLDVASFSRFEYLTAEEKLNEAQARVNKLKAVMSKQNRAAETRKKVLAGAAVLKL